MNNFLLSWVKSTGWGCLGAHRVKAVSGALEFVLLIINLNLTWQNLFCVLIMLTLNLILTRIEYEYLRGKGNCRLPCMSLFIGCGVYSFPEHSKSVLSIVLDAWKESTSAKPVLQTPSCSGSKFCQSLKLQKTLRISAQLYKYNIYNVLRAPSH